MVCVEIRRGWKGKKEGEKKAEGKRVQICFNCNTAWPVDGCRARGSKRPRCALGGVGLALWGADAQCVVCRDSVRSSRAPRAAAVRLRQGRHDVPSASSLLSKQPGMQDRGEPRPRDPGPFKAGSPSSSRANQEANTAEVCLKAGVFFIFPTSLIPTLIPALNAVSPAVLALTLLQASSPLPSLRSASSWDG